MRRIKIFTDDDPDRVEQDVNEWLAEHRSAIIHRMLQSETWCGQAWSLTITIFYYEGEA